MMDEVLSCSRSCGLQRRSMCTQADVSPQAPGPSHSASWGAGQYSAIIIVLRIVENCTTCPVTQLTAVRSPVSWISYTFGTCAVVMREANILSTMPSLDCLVLCPVYSSGCNRRDTEGRRERVDTHRGDCDRRTTNTASFETNLITFEHPSLSPSPSPYQSTKSYLRYLLIVYSCLSWFFSLDCRYVYVCQGGGGG